MQDKHNQDKDTTAKHDKYLQYLGSIKWRNFTAQIRSLYEHKCMLCNVNSKKIKLEVHHRDYSRLYNEKATDVILLCEDCHNCFHKLKKQVTFKEYLLGKRPIPPNGLVTAQEAMLSAVSKGESHD